MFPVALTSPLWWVARGMSRLFAGLAVALAFAAAGPALSGPLLFDPAPTALSTDASHSLPAAVALDTPFGLGDGIRADDRGTGRVDVVATDRVDAGMSVAPAGAARELPAATLVTPGGRVPAAVGPRAPPAG
ncbi:hypothetical protein FJK98_09745 [Micromonospora sp. HM134]|uniref:hypothetical protein n=1 Tax=unclassified Micromonospora TaxID=2617518 RepID=UPI001198C09A|nr:MULTISPECIES: hypothetical protein [unclassified Micromonospora]QDY07422.1 hypothetical protein FJK98_09745 [Micromonospora sp. HM134]